MTKRAVDAITSLKRPFVYGMIHVPALPGTPRHALDMKTIREIVRKETAIYAKAQVDGIIVENMHDIPYVKAADIGPEIVSCMALACDTVTQELGRQRHSMSLGVQILAAANNAALAVAHSTGFDMIRAEAFVFAHVADEGWLDGCAGGLLRYRRTIGADDIAVFTDVKKKHSSHAVTADLTVGGVAEAAQFFMADGVIVTGNCTGHQANPDDVQDVKQSCSLPVLVGSGVNPSNIAHYKHADGVVVGSQFKKDGRWENELVLDRVQEFMKVVKSL